MRDYALPLDSIPRTLSGLPALSCVYSLSGALGAYNGIRPNNIEFILRLSSADSFAVDDQNGVRTETPFPHVYVKLPGSDYNSHRFSARQAFVLIYPGVHLDYFRSCGIPLDRLAWPVEPTPLMRRAMDGIGFLADGVHQIGAADRIDALGWLLLREMALAVPALPADGDPRRAAVRKIASWYARHYAEKIDLDHLLVRFGLSRRVFFRFWSAEFAVSPKQYQISLRLHEAERLLSYGMSVSEAALRTGFEDVSRFSRFFAREYGSTPAKYKKN